MSCIAIYKHVVCDILSDFNPLAVTNAMPREPKYQSTRPHRQAQEAQNKMTKLPKAQMQVVLKTQKKQFMGS